MSRGYPRKKWISKSAHWKEGRKSYTGPGGMTDQPIGDRDGKATHVNTKPSVCVRCGADVTVGEGWLLLLPRGTGQKRSPFAVMCKACSSPECHTPHVDSE